MTLSLTRREAHLWLAVPEEIEDPALLQAYRRLLTPDEVARHDRFVFANGRHAYLVSRALVRTVLSRYAEIPAGGWRFEANALGRPEIAPVVGAPPLRFNLSHTAGLVACAVALDREVGVDVEDVDCDRATADIADRCFSAWEIDSLRALPAPARHERFFEYWTLKESYLKARGLGLSLPLDSFWFHLEPRPVRIVFDGRVADDPKTWQFTQLRPTPRHLGAIALRCGPGEPPLDLVTRKVTPLRD
jgi:4'-phosphopantetheinyl transferase